MGDFRNIWIQSIPSKMKNHNNFPGVGSLQSPCGFFLSSVAALYYHIYMQSILVYDNYGFLRFMTFGCIGFLSGDSLQPRADKNRCQ